MARFVFIMGGQSNMSGRAPIAGAPASVNGSRLYRWHQDDVTGFVQNPVEPMDAGTGESLSVAYDPDAAFGPQLAFADKLATLRPSDEIATLSVAKGSTTAANWAPDWAIRSLYGAMLYRARLIQAAGYAIAGVCWWQGESDAQGSGTSWSAGFTSTIHTLRADLGSPSLPVVFCQLGPNPNSGSYPGWDEVQKRQLTIRGPNLAMVTTSDLAVQSDKLHMTQASYVTAGQRMATAMHGLVP